MSGLIVNLPNLLYSSVVHPLLGALQDIAHTGYTVLTPATSNATHNGTHSPHGVTIELSDSDLSLFLKIKWFYALLSLVFYLFVVPLLLYFAYVLLFRPLDRVRRLGSIGYLRHEAGAMSKKEVANMIRKRRKIGEDLPPVYPNGWFRLLDTQQLSSGQVKEVTALGEHFAVYRTTKGKAHVLDAYCPHMGGNLAVGGRVKGDCLECPFHGWTFSGDGKCTDIPYSTKVPNFSKTKSWPCREMNGAIYVWYHCDGLEPQWEMPDIETIRSGKYNYKGRVEHHANTHIQDVPENGSDLAHLGHLHVPNVFSGADLSTQFDSWWNFIVHIFKAQCKGPMEGSPHISLFYLTHHLLVWNKYKVFHLNLNVYQIGPGIVHLHFESPLGNGVFVQNLTPVEPLHLVLTHNLYATWKMPTWVGKIFLAMEAIQVDRDVMIWNNKTFSPRPQLVKEDSLIAKYRRWYSQFYSENSPRLQMKTEDATW